MAGPGPGIATDTSATSAPYQDLVSLWNDSGTDIADGDTCYVDGTKTTHGRGNSAATSPATADTPLGVVVAKGAVANGKQGVFVRKGFVNKWKCNAGVTQHSALQCEAVVGSVVNAGATTERAVGYALTAAGTLGDGTALAGFCSGWLY